MENATDLTVHDPLKGLLCRPDPNVFFRRHHYGNSSSKLTIAVLLEIFDLQAKKKKDQRNKLSTTRDEI